MGPFLMAGKESLFLFGCFFVLYAMSASGDVMGDTEVRWRVAQRMVDTGWFDLPPGSQLGRYAPGRDGREYSMQGVGQSVCLVPFVIAGKCLALLPLPASMTADRLGQFLASLIFFPAGGALAVVLVYVIVVDVTGQRRVARWLAVIFGLATMHWHHSVNTYEESQVAVCLLTSVWAAQRAWRRDEFGYPLLALIAAGAGFCFRITSVVMTGPLVLVAMGCDLAGRPSWEVRKRRLGQWMLAGIVGALPFVTLVGVFNAVRFGNPLTTGHSEVLAIWSVDQTGARVEKTGQLGLFETPMKEGLTGMLFSPGKSVFLYNPVLLAALPGFVGLVYSHRRLAICVAAVFASTLLFHSKVTFWGGDIGWGPRYLASAMGPCTLALIPVLRHRWFPRLFAGLVTVSICVQVASIMYTFSLEFFQHPSHDLIPGSYVWRPGESHLWCRFRNIALHAAGRPIRDSVPQDEHKDVPTRGIVATPESLARPPTVNIFPFKARANTGSGLVFGVLLAVWVAGLAMLILLSCLWYRWLRSGKRTAQA